MTQQEFIAKERRVKEIENAALMNLATDEMIEEANKLRKEISEARKKSIEDHSEELLKKWGIAADAPVGTKCEDFR